MKDEEAILLGVAGAGVLGFAALALARGGEAPPPPPPEEVSGYWQLSWNVPRNGNDYACIANLYQGSDGIWHELELNLSWRVDHWLIDLGIKDYPTPPYGAKAGPFDVTPFYDIDWDGTFTAYLSATEYQYGNWPRLDHLSLIEITDTGTSIVVVPRVQNAQVVPVPDYFTEA